MKICTKCGLELTEDYFSRDVTKNDGLYSSCRSCTRAYRVLTGRTKIKELLPEGLKRCVKCKIVLRQDEFNKDSSKSDGLYPSCPECRRKAKGSEKRREKGEQFVDSSGYVRIAGMLNNKRLHVYLMEQIIGRPLRKDECVHHIDLNKTNNDPKNLKLMKRTEHLKMHSQERANAIKKPKNKQNIITKLKQ